MKQLRWVQALLVALVPQGSVHVPLHEAKYSAGLSERLALARPGEFLPIDIVLSDQVQEGELRLQSMARTKSERRVRVVASLKAAAARSQPALLDFLEEARRAGAVRGEIRRLWIRNVLSAEMTPDLVRTLAARADVALLHLDPPRGAEVLSSADFDPSAESAPTCGVQLIRAPEVWHAFGFTGRGVVVGVIDTGVCAEHPDIRGHLWQNPREKAGNGRDDDGNGFIDDVNGWNFESDTNDIADDSGHGSHVMGILAGDGNSGTQCGVAPDTQLMVLEFFDSFAGEASVWSCIQYGLENGADILSGSLGWPHRYHPERATWRAVCDNAIAAGAVLVIAGGNEHCDTLYNNITTPADVPAVIAVGAVQCNDVLAFFSSCGPISWQGILPYDDYPYPPGLVKPDVCAPGDSVISHRLCDGYRVLSGTSMATPHVAGVAALLLQADPSLDQSGVRALLESTSVDLGVPGRDTEYGSGRIDAFAAVERALANATKRRR